MKVKIVSDGTSPGTHIMDADGNCLEYVTAIDWHLEVDGLATAMVQFANIPVEVAGELRGYREMIDRYVEPEPEREP